jgi:hypothetical protein
MPDSLQFSRTRSIDLLRCLGRDGLGAGYLKEKDWCEVVIREVREQYEHICSEPAWSLARSSLLSRGKG